MKRAATTTTRSCSPPASRLGSGALWLLFTAGLALAASSLELPLCLFKAITGLPCPACGMGHACRAALHGHWAESVGHHPLGLPAALALGLVYAGLSYDLLSGKGGTMQRLARPWPWWAVALSGGLIAGVWLWRLFTLLKN